MPMDRTEAFEVLRFHYVGWPIRCCCVLVGENLGIAVDAHTCRDHP